MISVIKSLMDGDGTIVEKFHTTQKFWKEFFESRRDANVNTLAKELGDAQSMFELKLDHSRALAKEIMPYTALAYLYDEQNGFADNREVAHRVTLAFEQSMCSLEVKYTARRAAALFGLPHD